MRNDGRNSPAIRLTRLGLLGAGVLLLAGCATGYSFVQPDVAGSGGYYTSDRSYSGQGYYAPYRARPYYGGYGYNYGYGYGSGWTFGAGFSNAWNSPGYWGPWYATGFSSWGCYSWRCGDHYRWRHHRRHAGSWAPGRNPSGPPDVTDTAQPPDGQVSDHRERTREISAWRHDHYVRSPRGGVGGPYTGMPAMPAGVARPMPGESAFVSRGPLRAPTPTTMSAPRPAARPSPPVTPRPAFRPAAQAMPVQPAIQPPPRQSATPAVKIR